MKKFYFLFVLLSLSLFSFAQDAPYSRVKIHTGDVGLQRLLATGIGSDAMEVRPGAYVVCELSSRELAEARELGFPIEVIIEDVAAYYRERNAPYMDQLESMSRAENILNRDWPVPEGFELGSVGGFCSIDQMQVHLDNMVATYPSLISPKYTLPPFTHEGRQLTWLRLSDNPAVDEDEPEVLFTGMHHAREPIGMQIQLFFMYYLLENYATDPEVQYLVDNFEIYFVPIVNIDGYAYNILTDPAGGGMWRKNRRDNGDGSFGVDVNRNYGYMWGIDNEGSSPDPWDEVYRGPSAFSEPCAQAVRDFCNEHEFRIALNYHSYSNLLLYAWGFTGELAPDDDIMREYGSIMTKENHYTYGPGYSTIYATNGGSDDWMYGEQATKEKIFAYTPEVGGGDDGFWPSVSRIIPQCQENMWQNIMMVKLAGPYATVHDLVPSIMEEQSGSLEFEIRRLGLGEGATYTVTVEPLNDAIATVGDPVTFTGMELMETQTGSFDYTLREDIQDGEEVLYLLSVNNGYITDSDTISKFYGTPVVVFEDTASSMEKWTSAKWNTTTGQYHSPERSITDSPQGDYNDYETNILTLNQPIDLTTAAFAVLNFWAKWDIEAGYDYVQVQASLNNGSTWVPLAGKYTHPGSSDQEEGEPVYDGYQSVWVEEEISLEGFLDHEIKLRFILKSDVYVNGDGYYWDDMTVTIIDEATGIGEPGAAPALILDGPKPVPASDQVTFDYRMEQQGSSITLNIYDITGKHIRSMTGNGQTGTFQLATSGWDQGLYFYSFAVDHVICKTGKMIINH